MEIPTQAKAGLEWATRQTGQPSVKSAGSFKSAYFRGFGGLAAASVLREEAKGNDQGYCYDYNICQHQGSHVASCANMAPFKTVASAWEGFQSTSVL